MKKLFALLLAAMLCVSAVSALAEEGAIEVPTVEDGAWVQFEDYNIQICLPSDWSVLEVTDEQAESGVIFACASADAARTFTLAYSELEAASDMETVAASLAASYADVQMMNINGMDFASYTIAENDVAGLVTLGGSGIGLYQFVFYPASDAEYGSLATQIAASISTIE